MAPHTIITRLTDWIREYTPDANGILLPVSGGSDSAFCLWLCEQALPGRVVGVHAGRQLRERDWFESITTMKFLSVPKTKHANPEVARWAAFLTLSLQENRILVGARNRTEDTLGNYSLASRVATCLPIAGLWKHEVMELCRYVGVPASVMESSRQADPECGRPEELAAVPFEIVDRFLAVKLRELPPGQLDSIPPAWRAYLEDLYRWNTFKHNLPAKGPGITARSPILLAG